MFPGQFKIFILLKSLKNLCQDVVRNRNLFCSLNEMPKQTNSG